MSRFDRRRASITLYSGFADRPNLDIFVENYTEGRIQGALFSKTAWFNWDRKEKKFTETLKPNSAEDTKLALDLISEFEAAVKRSPEEPWPEYPWGRQEWED